MSNLFLCIHIFFLQATFLKHRFLVFLDSHQPFFVLFSPHPIYCLRPSFLSPSYQGIILIVVIQIQGHIAGSSPSRQRFAFFIARRFQLFLPSSTRVELCLPTLGALGNKLLIFLCFRKYIPSLTTAGIELQDQHYRQVAFRGLPLGRPMLLHFLKGSFLTVLTWGST